MKSVSLLRRSLVLCLLLTADVGTWAQESALDGTRALPAERVILQRLNGIVCVPDAASADAPVPVGFSGVDTSRTPGLADPAAADLLRRFLGKPASFASLDRLAIGVRFWLRATGQPFVVAYIPPQELRGGVVRLVVRRATLDGDLKIEGAQWFSEESYRAALPIAAGDEIDGAALQAGVERLNRNPYRRVALAAEAGGETGSTRLSLRAKEQRPWEFTLGANNTGTATTGRNRVTAGANWGNAFGRGDTLGYNYSADPDFKHSSSHSFNYGTSLASGNSLALIGSASRTESVLPEPLTQKGSSWQVGARYGMPLGKDADGWERNLSLAADFKYSDNNLEFAAIPVTNNAMEIAQFGAIWSSRREGAAFSASLYASPGKLSAHNDDASFDIGRAGAKARYVYGRLDGQYSQPLPRDFTWTINASAQAASGPLLGTEQLAGGGSAAVRGYPESSTFGDGGLLVSNALHLPAFSPLSLGGQADAFVFLDAASLHNRDPFGGFLHLASVGLGLNYQLGRQFSLTASYGRQLTDIPATAGKRSARGHIGAVFSF
ncbi:MAG: hypothetical protein NT159_00475 [Proteobacteria bacterium]|nr:hypothetical protein [Pseudomonadota bacterium]